MPVTKRDQGVQRPSGQGGGGQGGDGHGQGQGRKPLTGNYPNFRPNNQGLRVSLHKIEHLTAKGVLTKSPFRFQVPPLDEFSWEESFGWADYETISEGTYSRPAGRGLRVVSFESLFLDWDPSWAITGTETPTPLEVAHDLRLIMNSGTPFQIIVNQPDLWNEKADLDMDATLRNLRVSQRAGEVDARYINVEFVEFRDIELDSKREGSGGGGSGTTLPTRYKIEKGTDDTLYKLALKYYGSNSQWRLIYEANEALRNRNWSADRKLGDLHPEVQTLLIPARTHIDIGEAHAV